MSLTFFDRIWLRVFDSYRFAHGIRVQFAETEADIEACNVLAHKVFSDAGLRDNSGQALPPPDDGNECTLGMVTHRGKLVGMIDVVRSEGQFPVQYFFNVEFPATIEKNKIAEIGRIAILPEYRKRNSIFSISLLTLALRHADEHGITHWVMCAPALLRQGFRGFFSELNVLPENEITALQRKYRKHRENYFAARLGVQVFLIRIANFSVRNAAQVLIRRQWARSKWKRKSRSNNAAKVEASRSRL